MRANVRLNEECLEAFDVLTANGVDVPMTDAPITAVFRTTEEAERMLTELRELEKAGQQCMSPHCRARRYANKYPWPRRRLPPG